MDEPAIVVGAITKAHGLKGEVVVVNRSDNPDRWSPGNIVFLGIRELEITASRPHGARLLVSFRGVTDRTTADELRGELTVRPDQLPQLPEGEYWPHQLEGCDVVTDAGRALGHITDVIPNPANDLWVAVDDAGTETLIPALADVLLKVDLDSRQVLVRDIPGLTAPDAPDSSN
ncbi:MAG: rRNA processing protein RimM [Actinomycetota bacterium]|nr:rRNA processing protein RimM [Actinomycetota bacterium]MEA2580724.1 rRNA processing protein RimM [Actinomycetota bacterium]